MDNPIYILGDIHGHFDHLQRVVKANDIRDCTIISVGDIGIGFVYEDKQLRICDDMNDWFAHRNISFLGIRGNHDDPSYFTGDKRVVHSNFELLEDYTVRILNGNKFLFIGGAISVDRIKRKEGVSYWKDEALVLDESKIVSCDALVTHTAPTWIGPLDKLGLEAFVDYKKFDPTLWDECVSERRAVDKLIRESGARMHYCGHFHQYSWVQFGECYSTILDINQLKEHRML